MKRPVILERLEYLFIGFYLIWFFGSGQGLNCGLLELGTLGARSREIFLLESLDEALKFGGALGEPVGLSGLVTNGFDGFLIHARKD